MLADIQNNVHQSERVNGSVVVRDEMADQSGEPI